MPRHRLYREHKYVSFRLSEFSRFVAKADFTSNDVIKDITEKFDGIKGLMHGHAEHENKNIHELLRKKQSAVHSQIEIDHAKHESAFSSLDQILKDASSSSSNDDKIAFGNRFCIEFQRFEGDNLLHQFFEESVIMPELQRLYTDEEILNQVDGPVYAVMSVDDLVGMCKELFPHFNKDDHEAFLRDIKTAQPGKFPGVWDALKTTFDAKEQAYLISKLGIPTLSSSDKDKSTLSDKPNIWNSSASQPKPGEDKTSKHNLSPSSSSGNDDQKKSHAMM